MDGHLFELRTYTPVPGRLDALLARFRDHTDRLFGRHGMTSLGYWVPAEEPRDRLVYILAFPSREAADASWAAFRADPEWQRVRQESEADGPIVEKIDSLFLVPT